MVTRILFVTAHGDFPLDFLAGDSVADVLKRHGLPKAGISMDVSDLNSRTNIFVGLHKNVGDIEGETLRIIPDRNIGYHEVVNLPVRVVPSTGPAVTEYTFRDNFGLLHRELSAEECQAFVKARISAFLDAATILPDKPIVLGFSGGGDSNSMLKALVEHPKIGRDQLICVMLLGIPEWDNRLDEARALCAEQGVQLREVSAADISDYMGVQIKGADWITKFSREFPREDMEFVGTLAIKNTLKGVARKTGAQAIITGLNAEDVCAEILAAMTLGHTPAAFPVRNLGGDIDLWLPLYLVPKKIGDGCYPKRSRLNYQDRAPSHLYGRTLFYYMVQTMEDTSPGFMFDLIRGVEAGFSNGPINFKSFDDIPHETMRKWRKLFPLQAV